MNKRRIGILGTGWIADMMARTVAGMKEVEAYAVASRSLGKAKQFAESHGFTKAYGSYGELVSDPLVELVYIATPHSEHYENAKMCLMADKPVLCEKAFTAAAWQAQELMELSAQRGVFITEAIWTRYMPFSKTITELVNSGVIGTPTMLSANLCYYNIERERMYLPELAGGALLDLGVYAINFATMVFGKDVVKTTSDCLMTTSKVDLANTITWTYADGRYAVLYSSNNCKSERHGIISGTKGHIVVDNINNPHRADIYTEEYDKPVKTYRCPRQITGYEYQVRESFKAIDNGQIECSQMPHAETVRIMQLMDDLRREWGVRYPCDRW
ncbi:MAG: Gfo/Idh/MocA family oxidoreductase [Bacteroidaceae bacterium]|nr:Gfo/Idh/MocA family oxidoreductase [Bacteroidaceae bacterium]